MISSAERIESVKAGIVGAGCLASVEMSVSLLKIIFLAEIQGFDLHWLLEIAIATVSGFLFGVTYRYVVRNDSNNHLNDGAVLAFGLVRGLALAEEKLMVAEIWWGVLLVFQSLLGFAIARMVLDLAISRKLIKPFI